jgi:precorrin-2/cobalt-factor-2 C20-methyltransferase
MNVDQKFGTAAASAQPGCFYAVGIGPGAGDLLTLRAVRLIETADVILAPRSEASPESLALNTIRALLGKQKIIEHIYPMTPDNGRANHCWRQAAKLVAGEYRAGHSVVQVTVGDPLIYSTSVYLIEQLQKFFSSERIHIVPGITAFQAMAARWGEALTIQGDRLMLMPATDLQAVEHALGQCETLVLYKIGQRLPQIIALLRRHGLLSKARLASHVERLGREILLKRLSYGSTPATGYMSTVIIHIGCRKWKKT